MRPAARRLMCRIVPSDSVLLAISHGRTRTCAVALRLNLQRNPQKNHAESVLCKRVPVCISRPLQVGRAEDGMTRISWTTRIPWEAGVLFAGLMLAPAARLTAQAPNADPASGQLQGGGRGRGRFGQIPRPVQGTVTAVAGGKVTVKTDAGETYQITAGQTARVMRNRQPNKVT